MEDSHQNKNADQSYFFGTLGSFLCHIAEIEKINVEKKHTKITSRAPTSCPVTRT